MDTGTGMSTELGPGMFQFELDSTAYHEDIARDVGIDVFFAHPYHSWERGTNENTNGLIRRLYPKKSSFAGIGKAELKRIDAFLNDRPRKCLGWSTPRAKMTAFLGYAP